MTHYKQQSQQGFALLLTLVVVGAVISIGLSLLDLSTKQIRLSTNARQSEIAFHAANAGVECAQRIRRLQSDEFEAGDPISGGCFGDSFTNVAKVTSPTPTYGAGNDGDAFFYTYELDWVNSTDPRCTQVRALVAVSDPYSNGTLLTDVSDLIPGYDGTNDEKECDPGARCTVLSVRGYNKPCSGITGYGTIEREVLLQF